MSPCASLYRSNAKQIREDLNEQSATAELFPNETGKQQNNDKARSCLTP